MTIRLGIYPFSKWRNYFLIRKTELNVNYLFNEYYYCKIMANSDEILCTKSGLWFKLVLLFIIYSLFIWGWCHLLDALSNSQEFPAYFTDDCSIVWTLQNAWKIVPGIEIFLRKNRLQSMLSANTWKVNEL